MLKLLQWAFLGHVHKWETIKMFNLEQGSELGSRYILRCTKCGNIKMVDCI